MARTRLAQPCAEPLQVVPAPLVGDWASQLLARPLRHHAARPAVIRRERLLVKRKQETVINRLLGRSIYVGRVRFLLCRHQLSWDLDVDYVEFVTGSN